MFYQLYHIIYFCPIDALYQSNTNWCWAYAGNMVGSYHYISPPEATGNIANIVKGKIVLAYEGGSLTDARDAARVASNYTKNYTISNTTISDSSLKTRVLEHKPFIAVTELESVAKHAIAVCGFSYKNNELYVIISNPNNDRFTKVEYNTFMNNYNYMDWTDSIVQS